MTALYIINGLISLLALLGVFAPVAPMKASVSFRTTDEVDEDDVIFLEDIDDTQPFIWLPFHKVAAATQDEMYGEDEITRRIQVIPPPLPVKNDVPTREFPAYGNIVVWP